MLSIFHVDFYQNMGLEMWMVLISVLNGELKCVSLTLFTDNCLGTVAQVFSRRFYHSHRILT